MALKKEIKDKLKSWGFDVEALENAVRAESETDVTLPELIGKTELETRDKEVKKEGFKEGKKEGIKIANKTISDKFDLKDIDLSDPDKLYEALNNNFSKGDTALKEQIALLQKDKGELSQRIEAVVREKESALFDQSLLSMFPANRNPLLTDAEYLASIKMNLGFEDADGMRVVKRNGEILRDGTTKAPVPVKDAISGFFNERKWTVNGGNGGGRGGNDNPSGGAGIKSYSAAESKWRADNPGKGILTPEFNTYIQGLAKEKDFDMNA